MIHYPFYRKHSEKASLHFMRVVAGTCFSILSFDQMLLIVPLPVKGLAEG